jgi:predicted Zn-dependent protease
MAASSWTIDVSGDWGTAGNWSGGVPNSVTTTATIFQPAAFTVSIGASESFTVDTIYDPYGGSFLPTVDVAGTLTIAENNGSSEIGNLTIAAGGLLALTNTTGTGVGSLDSQQTLENDGTLVASGTSGTSFQLGSNVVITNNGTFEAAGGSSLVIEPTELLTNFSTTGTLTGGTYVASGNGSAVFVYPLGGLTPIVTDAATLVLAGPGTDIYGYSFVVNNQVAIEASLTSIAAGGVLSVLGGRGYAGTTSITDAGLLDIQGGTLTATSFTLAAGGTLEGFGTIEPSVHGGGGTVIAAGGTLDVSAPVASLTAEAGGVLALSGVYTGPIQDNGAIAVMHGSLVLDGSIGGTGSLFVEGQVQNNPTASGDALMTASVAPTLELNTAFGGIIRFNGAASVVQLLQPASFTGSLVGFGAGDTLDVSGITNATATLTPDGTITLLSLNGTGGGDTITLDGTGYTGAAASNAGGGSAVTVTGPVPQDYELEPFHWASKVITWAFATTNYSQDSTTPFSSAISASQSLEQQAVEGAFSAWAAVAGLTFEQVADTSNPANAADIRIGWGDLSSGGELGQASYTYFGDLATTDEIIRLQDPAQTNFHLSGSSPSGLVYVGTSSNFEAVVIHEIGHDLGLFHSTDTLAVMYPVASNVNGGINASDIAAIQSLYGAPACFASGTKLLAASGPRPVEELCVGEAMVTASGRLARVGWIGHRRLATATHPRPFDVMPVRVRAGALGENLPLRDLVLSPDHAVFVDGRLVPIRHLVNGVSIIQENRPEVTYWHVELDRHDLVLAEGMACESYLDTGNRAAFAGEAAMQLHPAFAAAASRAEWDARGCAAILTDPACPELRAAHLRLLARARAAGDVAVAARG